MIGDRASVEDLARRFALTVVALTLANALFNLGAVLLGAPLPYTTFLFDPADRFGDFFKVVLGLPGGSELARGDMLGLGAHVRAQLAAGYDPAVPAAATPAWQHRITLFHLTPLSTVLALAALAGARVVNVVVLFALPCLAQLAYLWCIVRRAAGRAPAFRWALLAALASYPLLLVWDRGNLFAGAASLMIVHAMIVALRGGPLGLAALLLAVAINIRPNAAVFVLPMAMLYGRCWMRASAICLAAALAIGSVALLGAHIGYPAYGWASFAAGLERYRELYVVGDDGLAYGSSLLGATKLLLGYRGGAEWASAMVAGAAVAIGAAGFAAGRLRASTFLFFVCAGYALGSAVFGDYHLLVFFVVPLAQLIEREPARTRQDDADPAIGPIVLVASVLMLSPKNYLFNGDVSLQVLLNPALLLAAACAIVGRMRAARPLPRAAGPYPA